MKKVWRDALIKSIEKKWLPKTKGSYGADCALCKAGQCSDCPVYDVYGICHDMYKWKTYNEWRNHKTSENAVPVLQDLIKLLPKTYQKKYKKYMELK